MRIYLWSSLNSLCNSMYLVEFELALDLANCYLDCGLEETSYIGLGMLLSLCTNFYGKDSSIAV